MVEWAGVWVGGWVGGCLAVSLFDCLAVWLGAKVRRLVVWEKGCDWVGGWGSAPCLWAPQSRTP
jgi:hypothetical protein